MQAFGVVALLKPYADESDNLVAAFSHAEIVLVLNMGQMIRVGAATDDGYNLAFLAAILILSSCLLLFFAAYTIGYRVIGGALEAFKGRKGDEAATAAAAAAANEGGRDLTRGGSKAIKSPSFKRTMSYSRDDTAADLKQAERVPLLRPPGAGEADDATSFRQAFARSPWSRPGLPAPEGHPLPAQAVAPPLSALAKKGWDDGGSPATGGRAPLPPPRVALGLGPGLVGLPWAEFEAKVAEAQLEGRLLPDWGSGEGRGTAFLDAVVAAVVAARVPESGAGDRVVAFQAPVGKDDEPRVHDSAWNGKF